MENKPLSAIQIHDLIEKQKKAFAAAKTANGIVYFNLIGKMIDAGEIKPPKGLNERQLKTAYDEAAILVGEREMAKSVKKNRANEKNNQR